MRSEVVKVKRDMGGSLWRESVEGWSVILGHMTPEIPVGETKSVRISVEIEDEKGEEKVGSKASLIRRTDGYSYLEIGSVCRHIESLDHIVKDWQPGESRTVKSILFATPDGVPVVEFVEAPRERLKRQAEDASIKGSAVDAFGLLMAGVQDYLAATAGEGK